MWIFFYEPEVPCGTLLPLPHFSIWELRVVNRPPRPAYLCVISCFFDPSILSFGVRMEIVKQLAIK